MWATYFNADGLIDNNVKTKKLDLGQGKYKIMNE